MQKPESVAKRSVVRTRSRGKGAGFRPAGWLVALLFVVLAACGEEVSAKRGTLTLPVDASLVPVQSTIGSRSVARMMGESGIPMDFFLGELVVSTDDQAKLDAFLARWGGTVVKSTDRAGDVARIHQVRLDPAGANVERLVSELNAKAPDAHGSFRSSSDAAAKLLAVALSEANANGMLVTPNFVVSPDAIADGSTIEAPTGAGDDPLYTRNAFDWPYMNRGSAQDIGVGAAWQVMERAGVFRNKVRMMILDGGFMESADMPVSRSIVGNWSSPNINKCGDSDCPWHGTMVATAAMGKINDGYGAAGAAAPVGELLAVPIEADFFALVWTLERIIGATIFGDPKIINVSSSMELDVGWDIAVKAACLGLCPSISEMIGSIVSVVTATNKLIFASAGNRGKDVDNDGASIEGSTIIPCELATVICVGGMAHDSTRRADGSNFGSKADDSSVDIYGPYSVFVGPDPDNLDNRARLKNGTSFSSPFVAGVAALVWASNPALSNVEVWSILRDTAHVGGIHDRGGNQRRINAFGAIARVLAGAPPVITLNPRGPTAPLNREWSVTAAVNDDGNVCPPATCPLAFEPAPTRTLGNTAFYRFDSAGSKTVTVTARDAVGQSASASVSVNVVNSPPVVAITSPANGDSVHQDVPVQLLGIATDINEGADPGPGALFFCKWTSSNASDVFTDLCDYPHVFTTQGTRTLTLTATDPEGASSSTSITLTVTPPPPNFPPNIVSMTRLPQQPTYAGGFAWDTTQSLGVNANDPEGDNPITYVWKATSFRPNSTTPYASNVTIGTSANVSWTPSATAGFLGAAADLGNDCYDGQTVRIRVEASDSLGNKRTRTLPDIKVFRCILH